MSNSLSVYVFDFSAHIEQLSFCSGLIGIGPRREGAGLDGFLGNGVLSAPALTG